MGASALLGSQTARAADSGPTQTGPDICMQSVFDGGKLNCTANDIRLSGVKDNGVSPTTCIEGTTFDLTATFLVDVTANSRYDAGFFFRIDGGLSARGDGASGTGVCSLSGITPPDGSPTPLDGDTCGDFNAGQYEVTFTIPDVECNPVSATNRILRLPYCTSWHSNQATFCSLEGSDPDTTFDIDEAGYFHPDTKSKCVCDDTFTLPITVESPGATLVMAPAKAVVQYDVTATNTATTRQVRIDALCDNRFGTIEDVGNNCAAGNTTYTVIDTTCVLPHTLQPASAQNDDDEYTCSYSVEIDAPGLGTLNPLTNTVTGKMADAANNAPVSPAPSDSGKVTIVLSADP